MKPNWNITFGQNTQVKPRVVLDTDTFNEIDDQFALAYLLLSKDALTTEAIYAAPFKNQRADSAEEGMLKSFDEIGRLLNRLDSSSFPHFTGARHFLTDQPDPVMSDAVSDLIERSKTATEDERLTIIAIGALTNIATALLLAPDLIHKCNIIWLGGHALNWPDNREFNLCGDIEAVRVVYDSGIPLYVVPCEGVASHLTSCREELREYLNLEDPLSSFLYERFSEYLPGGMGSKEIWDIAAVAWMVIPESVKSYTVATPRIAQDGSYIKDPRRAPCRFAYKLDRDMIYRDLFKKLSRTSSD